MIAICPTQAVQDSERTPPAWVIAWAVFGGRVCVLIDERLRRGRAVRKPFWVGYLVYDEHCWERLKAMRRRPDGRWAVEDEAEGRRCFEAICRRDLVNDHCD